ncbi:MAG: CoA-binding protein, partial [Promethearchaeota archaeon]
MSISNDNDLAELEVFFRPTSLVLFGVSRKVGKSGNFIIKNMVKYGASRLFIIHPKADEIMGVKCYKSLEKLSVGEFGDEKAEEHRILNIDLAIIALPVSYVTETAIECIKYGIKGILIESGNIGNNKAEIKENSKRLKEAQEHYAKIHGYKTRIMGPNSLGVFNNFAGIETNEEIEGNAKNGKGEALHLIKNRKIFFTAIMETKVWPVFLPIKNNLSIVAQTGLVVSGFFIDILEERDVAISKIMAIGNKFDFNECDALEYLNKDPYTKVIAMYLEDIKDGRRFYNLCKEAIYKYGKKIVILPSGTSELGQKAKMSHTNSLSGNSAVFRGMCKQLGIICVESLHDLLLTAKILTHIKIPENNSAGLISISGAGCVLMADFAERFGYNVPDLNKEIIEQIRPVFPEWADISHPVDMWASIEKFGAQVSYDKVIETFLNSGQFNIIFVASIAGRRAILDYDFFKNMRKKYPDVPIIFQVFGGWSDLKTKLKNEFQTIYDEGLLVSADSEDMEKGTPAHGMTSNTIHPSIKFDPIEESNSMFYIPISYDLE